MEALLVSDFAERYHQRNLHFVWKQRKLEKVLGMTFRAFGDSKSEGRILALSGWRKGAVVRGWMEHFNFLNCDKVCKERKERVNLHGWKCWKILSGKAWRFKNISSGVSPQFLRFFFFFTLWSTFKVGTWVRDKSVIFLNRISRHIL